MKGSIRAKANREMARDLFAELSEGIEALSEARAGRRTLRTHAVEVRDAIKGIMEGGEAAFNLREKKSGF